MNRWWIYQRERFPVFKNGLLIAVFSLSAVGYALLLQGGIGDRSIDLLIRPALVAFLTLFLFFLQLRIADEFKDFAEDAQYRPYRPVPRGLVTLRELGVLGLGAGVVQFGLAWAIGLPLVLLLLLVWGYLGLMSKEFFASHWLKAHPIAYLLSHAVIMPLMALYATACEWFVTGDTPASGLVWFLLISWFVSLTIEIGRKIRAPEEEETGVETYTALWGKQRAVVVWLTVVWLLALSAIGAANQINLVVPTAFVLLVLLTGSLLVAWRFLAYPAINRAKWFETLSGLWTLLIYLSVGIVPLFLR